MIVVKCAHWALLALGVWCLVSFIAGPFIGRWCQHIDDALAAAGDIDTPDLDETTIDQMLARVFDQDDDDRFDRSVIWLHETPPPRRRGRHAP